MCGRFTLRSSPLALADVFGPLEFPDLSPRYNIAPTQQVLALSLSDGHRTLAFRRWGLVPSWADDPAIGNRLLNARAETVPEKPSFRSAFKRHRCLILADGFYEWKTLGKAKQPFFIHRNDDQPFAFAGLSEHWHRGGETIHSCTIITTEANQLMRDLHDRMPVILSPNDFDIWLDNEHSDLEKVRALMVPYQADDFRLDAVSTYVNNARHEGAECLAPAT